MKKLGKALSGLALVMVLTLGMLGGSANALTWDPSNPVDIFSTGQQWEYSGLLTLSTNLTMQSGSSLIAPQGVVNHAQMVVNDSSIWGDFTSDSNGDLKILGAMRVGGFLSTPGLDQRILGRVAPRPPPPPPGQSADIDNDAFWNEFESETGLLYGVGIFATGPITIGSLNLVFDSSYTPNPGGDAFLVAMSMSAAEGNDGINIGSLDFDRSKFSVQLFDPIFDYSGQKYGYAYVTVSAIPEPGTILLLGLGLLGLAGIGRKRPIL